MSRKIFINSFNRKVRKRLVYGPCLLGIIIYLAGFFLFVIEGLTDFYLEQWWIPLIIWAVSWMSLAFNWADGKFEDIYTNAFKNYEITSNQSEMIIENFFSRVTQIRRGVAFSCPWIIVFFVYIILAHEGLVWIPPEIVENILFRPSLVVYAVILALITAYHMGIGALLVIEHIRVVKQMSKFNLITTPLDLRCESGLHELGKISLISSFFWFANVGVGIPLIMYIIDYFTIISLSALITIGLLILLLPQLYIRKSILSYKKELLCKIAEKFRDEWKNYSEKERSSDILGLFKLYDEVDKIEGWPFGKRHTFQEVLFVMIPLIPSIIPFLQ